MWLRFCLRPLSNSSVLLSLPRFSHGDTLDKACRLSDRLRLALRELACSELSLPLASARRAVNLAFEVVLASIGRTVHLRSRCDCDQRFAFLHVRAAWLRRAGRQRANASGATRRSGRDPRFPTAGTY